MDGVTILIPHYGDEDVLVACLDALEYTRVRDVEWWDGNKANHGFAGNCNRLAARADDAETFVFLNNDCLVQPGWLEPLVAALEHHPIAGSLLLYPDGKVQHSGVAIHHLPGRVVAQNLRYRHPSGEVDAVTGACLAIRAETFWSVDGFDEGFYNGYEDVDLCLKVREATGQRCWFAADSVVTHGEAQSGPERWVKVRENEARLSEKWGGRCLP